MDIVWFILSLFVGVLWVWVAVGLFKLSETIGQKVAGIFLGGIGFFLIFMALRLIPRILGT